MMCVGSLSRRIGFIFALLAAVPHSHTAIAAQLTLTWRGTSTNTSGFKIERKTGAGGTYAQVVTLEGNVTSFNDMSVADGITYCYRVRAFNSVGVSAPSNEDCGTTSAGTIVLGSLPPGLAAAYNFDEGRGITASDSSGNGNTGTLVNTPTWTTGKFGNALFFNGVNQYVRVANSSSLNIIGDITITAWVKGLNTTYENPIVAKHNGSASWDYDFYIYKGAMWFWADGQSQVVVKASVTFLDTTKWHHVAVTRNNGTVTFYLDGNPAGSRSMQGKFKTNASTVDIGCDSATCNTPDGLLRGSIDAVRIYNRALSASQIQTDMLTATATAPSRMSMTTAASLTATSAASLTATSAPKMGVGIGVFRPSTGKWYLDRNGNGIWDGCQVDGCLGPFGQPGNYPIIGDWIGTGTTQVGVFASSTGLWKLDRNGNDRWDSCAVDLCLSPFGQIGDLPVVGHWKTISGADKIGFYRPSQRLWRLDLNGNGVWDGCAVDGCLGPFGLSGDLPVAGDWDGTGRAKIGVFDPQTGLWELDLNGNGVWDGCTSDSCVGPLGQTGDIPVVGRW
jgi:hypothetical protein